MQRQQQRRIKKAKSQSCDNITVKDIIKENGVITVKLEFISNNIISNYSTEIIGDTCYIRVNANTGLTKETQNFIINIANKNNSIKNIYITNEKKSKLIYTNSEYGKPNVFYGNTEIK